MKIRVIGSADMNSAYMSASYLINGSILVDIPGGVLKYMKRGGIASSEIKSVLITHLHADHTMDLPLWVLQKTKEEPPVGEKGIPIHLNAQCVDYLQQILHMSFSTSLTAQKMAKFVDWNTDDVFSCEGLKFTRVPVIHGNLPGCCGYKVTDGETTVGFTGDACLCDGVLDLAQDCNLLFADCDLINGNEKHMGIDSLHMLSELHPSCRIVATHLKDETREELLRLGDIGITVAEDGMLIDTTGDGV